MKALEICVSPGVYTIHKLYLLKKTAFMAIYHRIDQDILSRKSSHKDTPISVLFLDILVGKFNKKCRSAGIHVISPGP